MASGEGRRRLRQLFAEAFICSVACAISDMPEFMASTPVAAVCMLEVISLVTADCSSTALAIEVEMFG